MDQKTIFNQQSPSIVHVETDNVEEYQEMLGANHAPVTVEEKSSQKFSFTSDFIITGGFCFSRTLASEMKLNFHEPFDGYGLNMPRGGIFSLNLYKDASAAAPDGCGLLVDSSSVKSAVIQSSKNLERIAITSGDMHKRLSELIGRPILQRIEFSSLISLRSSTALMAFDVINILYDGENGASPILKYPAALASLRELVLNLILEGIPHNYTEYLGANASSISSRSVRRASEYITQHAARPLSIADIALASNCSVRSLQAGFIRYKGMSPMAYLKLVRLNGVRAELISGIGNKNISEVAHSWGFSHLSAFSSVYRAAFGEKPSETLKNVEKP